MSELKDTIVKTIVEFGALNPDAVMRRVDAPDEDIDRAVDELLTEGVLFYDWTDLRPYAGDCPVCGRPVSTLSAGVVTTHTTDRPTETETFYLHPPCYESIIGNWESGENSLNIGWGEPLNSDGIFTEFWFC